MFWCLGLEDLEIQLEPYVVAQDQKERKVSGAYNSYKGTKLFKVWNGQKCKSSQFFRRNSWCGHNALNWCSKEMNEKGEHNE